MAQKEPKHISLRFKPEYADAAELLARASGEDGTPLMNWIIRFATIAAAERLGVPVPHIPPLRSSIPPPDLESVTQAAAEKGLSLPDVIAALQIVIDAQPAKPIHKPEYSLTRNMTPAQLNKAIRGV